MRRFRTIAAFATLALVASVPASSQQVIGSFDGITLGGNAGGGLLPVSGWALAIDGVQRVVIRVNGRTVGTAEYGLARPAVTEQYPFYIDSQAPGFAHAIDTTRFLNGVYEVTAMVVTNAGEKVVLSPARQILFTNTTHNLVPFGGIAFPNPNSQLFGACDLGAERRYVVVTGWALDPGIEIGKAGVGYVELLVDGSIVANTRRDCSYLEEAFGLVNCYGFPSPNAAMSFPSLPDSATANYRFVMDIGYLIELFGYSRGRHQLTIRVGDISGQVADIEEIPVDFRCDTDVDNQGSFGRIGAPVDGRVYSGIMRAVGWALDWEGVSQIEVSVDGEVLGFAVHGWGRPGVRFLYPSYPESNAPGWTFLLDTTLLSDGSHHLQVTVIDIFGDRTLIGERDFFVFNPS